MSPKKKHPRRNSSRPQNRREPRARPIRPQQPEMELPHLELLAGIEDELSNPHPAGLLTFASAVAASLDPRSLSPLERHDNDDTLTVPALVESFLDVAQRPTDALALVLKEFTGNDLLKQQVRRDLTARKSPVPGWLRRLDEVRPYRAIAATHVLGDGENIIVGVDLPGRHELTILIYIDHNLGTLVKDAFLIEQPLSEVITHWSSIDNDSADLAEISLADARARVEQAIAVGAMTFPPLETETWPMIRPLTEWITGMMPTGGSGYARPEYTEKQLADITNEFFASQHGAVLDNADTRGLLESLMWFGTGYGPGDPLRWSPVSVELLLADFIPRKIVADAQYLSKTPALLRALIRYAHSVRGIPTDLTHDTLAAVDSFEPDFQKVIRQPRAQGPMALLERMGLPVPPDEDDGLSDDDDESVEEYLLSSFAEEVGGGDVLDTLSDASLPDEPLDLSAVPEPIHERVKDIADLIDSCCDELFDTEFRTASRRLLARVAHEEPTIFRRAGKASTAAAAVVWIIGKANLTFENEGPRVQDMMAHFGLKGSPSQRASTLLHAIGVYWNDGESSLGDADLLTSRRRSQLISMRDLYRARLAEQDAEKS
ncbi:DUF6398 domain-containing protein [Paramicrobacterium fandaimingii]|uniref:DUF6398 domain-containing protein n=1 Tax=Paramicrobacterium fandaimingii TaxID=2708079 RepID=UPI0014213478|nr:DUF6398 domain-containing protein [Microbacterium fandaimingii]